MSGKIRFGERVCNDRVAGCWSIRARRDSSFARARTRHCDRAVLARRDDVLARDREHERRQRSLSADERGRSHVVLDSALRDARCDEGARLADGPSPNEPNSERSVRSRRNEPKASWRNEAKDPVGLDRFHPHITFPERTQHPSGETNPNRGPSRGVRAPNEPNGILEKRGERYGRFLPIPPWHRVPRTNPGQVR
jgi:hypothetical protein